MVSRQDDNAVLSHAHPRYLWLLMVKPVLALLAVLIVLNIAYFYQEAQKMMPWLSSIDILLLNLLVITITLVPYYIWCRLEYENFFYIIKNEELVIRKGIILRRHNAIPYNKIRNVQRLQGVLERIFGLCTISIETADVSLEFPDSVIPGILNSRELTEKILKKTHANQDAEVNLGNTMRQILSQLKELNERSQRAEDRKR